MTRRATCINPAHALSSHAAVCGINAARLAVRLAVCVRREPQTRSAACPAHITQAAAHQAHAEAGGAP